MKRTNLPVALLVAIAVTYGMASASRTPMASYPSSAAMLRLAWSARPERLEQCRTLTADELVALPEHMRQPTVCEGAAATYRLEVRVDDVLVVEQVVHGGGLRRDRRLYVFREVPVQPGAVRLDVRFTRIARPDPQSVPLVRAEFVPATLRLQQQIHLEPRHVALVTYDAERRSLVAVQGPTAP